MLREMLPSELSRKKAVLPGSTSEYLYYGKPIDKNAAPSPGSAYGAVKAPVRYLRAELAGQLGVDFFYAIITGIYADDRRDNNVVFYTIDLLLHDGHKGRYTQCTII